MLRLFPRFWFNRASATQRRHAEQVDALRTHWRTWLAKGIGRVVADDSIDESSAVARLEDLSPTQLLELDRVLRFGWWDMGDGPGQLPPVRLVPINGRRPEDDAFLFVASSHPNGFVREQTVLTLKHYPGRLALAAALIRCDDWVHEVRVAASELLVHLVGESPGDDMIALLPLVLTLRQRNRFSGGIWPNVIERKLLEPAWREARWIATVAKSAEVRGFAFQLVLRADPDRTNAALLRAVSDEHPGIALWALEQAEKVPESEISSEVLAFAARHRRASVRAQALRKWLQSNPSESEPLLQRAIFDPARAPRNAAAYFLRAALQRSALPAWRAAVDGRSPNKNEIALAALSEHAEAGDSVRLMAHLGHVKPRLRAMALRGLARTGSPDLVSALNTALFDRSARIVKQAIRLIEHSGEAIDRSLLEAAYERASSAPLRAVYVRAARLLAQWESLEVLLTWAGHADAETFLVVTREIERWQRFQNRRFAALPDGARAALMARLTAVSAGRPSRVWEGIKDVLRPL